MDDSASRRRILQAGAAAGLAAVGLAVTGSGSPASAAPLKLTQSCRDGDQTPSQMEGPFFKRNSPQRTNLVVGGVSGVLLSLRGTVYTQRCVPIPGALLEFWQADRYGRYDNVGYTLRGHQYSAADGTYSLETVVPKDYRDGATFRTSHIHVKVQRPGGRILTSQLYFPSTTQAYGMNVGLNNSRDSLYIRSLEIVLGPLANNRYPGTFDFVIR
ncbi:dioxygenase family protein [Longispora urticae]